MTDNDTDVETTASQRTRQRIDPPGSWNWHVPTPFTQAWRVGDVLITGGQLSADEDGNIVGPGDIEVQTRNVFDALSRLLEQAGATWHDVIKLNTFYVCDETGQAVQDFWEKMSKVRFEYLPTPGPAGTAIRVAGLMYDGFLIEAEIIAVIGSGRPEHIT